MVNSVLWGYSKVYGKQIKVECFVSNEFWNSSSFFFYNMHFSLISGRLLIPLDIPFLWYVKVKDKLPLATLASHSWALAALLLLLLPTNALKKVERTSRVLGSYYPHGRSRWNSRLFSSAILSWKLGSKPVSLPLSCFSKNCNQIAFYCVCVHQNSFSLHFL